MLDTTPTLTTTATDWRTGISVGDVVLFCFPVNEEGKAAKPKARPCLVVDVTSLAGERFVTLAYGTTSACRTNSGQEVHIRTRQGRLCAGLDRATRFICTRRITVSPDHPGFAETFDRSSPVLGRLDAEAMDRLQEIRARIHALRDIAAERRSRQGGHRRPAVRGVDFTVESRHPQRRVASAEVRR